VARRPFFRKRKTHVKPESEKGFELLGKIKEKSQDLGKGTEVKN